MGHQTRFYVTPKDMVNFQERLRQRTDFLILHSRSPSASPRVVDSLNFSENGKPWYFLYLARPEDLDAIVMKYIDTQGYWSLEQSPSPVVELICCGFKEKEKRLRGGRIYYEDTFLNDKDEFEMKPESFRTWAKMVNATLKKFLKRRKSPSGDYIGPDAQAWLDAGGGHLEDSGGHPVP